MLQLLKPVLCNRRKHCNEKPVHSLQLESSPCSLQLEKTCTQQQRSSTAQNKEIKIFFKEKICISSPCSAFAHSLWKLELVVKRFKKEDSKKKKKKILEHIVRTNNHVIISKLLLSHYHVQGTMDKKRIKTQPLPFVLVT